MARIIYALSGQGRGHTSRVMAISGALRERGHEILFCCGGTALEILEERGEFVLPVPALRQVMQGNEVQLGETMRCNLAEILRFPQTISELADAFSEFRPDLLITDFEAFTPHAARRVGVPVLSFNHQQVVTETRFELPVRHLFQAGVTAFAIRLIAPWRPQHVLVTSFFFPPLKRPESTTLVPPIIRPAVQALTPTSGDHIVVYYNHTDGAGQVLDTLAAVPATFVAYNFERPEDPSRYPNIRFKEPSIDGFLEDLSTCRAVICTAGFTLMSEALYLGKPLLVVPNRGIFEQTLNALFLERDGLGKAVFDRPLSPADLTSFLSARDGYEARLRGRVRCGNREAVACIERVLRNVAPTVFPRSTAGLGPGQGDGASAPLEKADEL